MGNSAFFAYIFRMKIVNLAIVLISLSAISAHAQNAQLSATAERFIAAHSDHAATLVAEERMCEAIVNNDSAFFFAAADKAAKETLPLMRSDNPEFASLALRLGPCEYASIQMSLIGYAVASDIRKIKRAKPINIQSLLPSEMLESFEEQTRRCELVKRLPKSVRRLHR